MGIMKQKEHQWKHVGGPMYADKADPQYEEFKQTQKETGVSPDELWSFFTTIACFILPRMKMFREYASGSIPRCFRTSDEWVAEIDKMIDAFSLIAEEKEAYDKQEKARIKAGLNSFIKYFFALWC